jgi:hypothetical protein
MKGRTPAADDSIQSRNAGPVRNLYLAEAKSANAILPNAAAGASAPMLRFDYFIIVVSPI